MNSLSRLIVILLIIASSISSCKKIDEGVLISLRSKKNRIINTWQYAYIIDLSDGSKQTAGLDGWSEQFEKNGNYTKTINYIGNVTQYLGKWTYDDKKTLYIDYTAGSFEYHEKYTILRLAHDEMKIRSDNEEKYFRSN